MTAKKVATETEALVLVGEELPVWFNDGDQDKQADMITKLINDNPDNAAELETFGNEDILKFVPEVEDVPQLMMLIDSITKDTKYGQYTFFKVYHRPSEKILILKGGHCTSKFMEGKVKGSWFKGVYRGVKVLDNGNKLENWEFEAFIPKKSK